MSMKEITYEAFSIANKQSIFFHRIRYTTSKGEKRETSTAPKYLFVKFVEFALDFG